MGLIRIIREFCFPHLQVVFLSIRIYSFTENIFSALPLNILGNCTDRVITENGMVQCTLEFRIQ